jgi:hypothetical protein
MTELVRTFATNQVDNFRIFCLKTANEHPMITTCISATVTGIGTLINEGLPIVGFITACAGMVTALFVMIIQGINLIQKIRGKK